MILKIGVVLGLLGFFTIPISLAQLRTIQSLPATFNEISGIQYDQSGKLWAINDGGNASLVYYIDTTGKILAQYPVKASNTDWEDLAASDRHLFIGDFGNNNNRRKDMHILMIQKSKLSEKDTVEPDYLHFSFEDQHEFPPAQEDLEFDCEALFYYMDSLYLFSKNRSKPFNGWIKMYVLPAKGGTYIARLKDSMQYRTVSKELGWITAADVGMENFILLSSSFVIYQPFKQSPSFEKQHQIIELGHFSQKESLSIMGLDQWLLADEKFTGLQGPNLYSYKRKTGKVGVVSSSDTRLRITDHELLISNPNINRITVSLYNFRGQLVKEEEQGWSKGVLRVSLKELNNGTYFAIISGNEGLREVRKFIWKKDG